MLPWLRRRGKAIHHVERTVWAGLPGWGVESGVRNQEHFTMHDLAEES